MTPRLLRADSFADAVSLVRSIGDVRFLAIDVEMTLVPCGSPPSEMAAKMRESLHLLSSLEHLRMVLFVSNARAKVSIAGPDPVPFASLFRARKPFGPRQRISDLVRGTGGNAVVIGDQILTDGILAFLLGCSFIQTKLDCAEPAYPRVQRGVGDFVGRFLFDGGPRTTPERRSP